MSYKKITPNQCDPAYSDGRGDKIRTCDPIVPNDVRYQTALQPVHVHTPRIRLTESHQVNTSFYYSVWLDNDRLTIAFRKGERHGTSPAGRSVRHHLLCDMRRYRLVRHERIHAVRPGHLACHAASVHRLRGNRGRMRSRFIQFGLRTKITFADTQTWLGYSGPSYFRDPRAFHGV